MTSKIVVNNIEADSGVSTVTFGSKISSTEFVGPVVGNVTGNVTGDVTGNVTGDVIGNLTGDVTTSTGNITVGTGVTLNSPSDNVLNIQTNGSTRIRVGAGGSVNIGGSDEIFKFQVTGPPANGTNYCILHIRDSQTLSGVAGTGGIFLSSSPGTDYYIAKGYDGSSSRLKFGNANNANEYMAIDASGRVTMPYQPSFAAYDNRGGATVSASGNISQYFTNAPHNVGGHYATSGANVGRFTAPVAGRYLFGWNFFPYTTAVDSSSRMGITVNGNGGSYPGMIQGEYLAYTNEGTLLVHLNANDYVRWETQTSAHVYWYNSDPRHNRIWGYFLG